MAMAQLCFTAIATDCETWRKLGNAHSFRMGMADRLNQRILDLIPRSTSMALVPLKRQLVAKTGVHLHNVNRSTTPTTPASPLPTASPSTAKDCSVTL